MSALSIAIAGMLRYTPAPATGFSDDFSNPTTSAANWAATLQGTAGGTYAFNTGSAVLTPKPSATNSVALRHTGTFKDAAVTAAIASNPGAPQYLALSLGTGTIIAYGNGTNWYYTVLKSGYSLLLGSVGNMTLVKSTNGSSTSLGAKSYTDSNRGLPHVYELIVTPTGVSAVMDGVTMITSTDTTFAAGGDILIAQGEHTTGNGGIATLTQVTAS